MNVMAPESQLISYDVEFCMQQFFSFAYKYFLQSAQIANCIDTFPQTSALVSVQ